MERQFLEKGLERANRAAEAEIVVLNTCTVTEGADKDARASIRRLQRSNPGCQILVTGCYAQRAPEEIAALPGVKWVVGNSHKHQAAEIVASSSPFPAFVSLEQLQASGPRPKELSGADTSSPYPEVVVGDIFAHTELMAAPVFDAASERTRPNLKIQDGCDNRCSFCVIPYVRGQSRSMPSERVIAEIRALVDAGYREVVISGINLGRWGRDLPVVGRPSSGVGGLVSTSLELEAVTNAVGATIVPERLATDDQRFVHLIRAILDQTPLAKLRISSVEPMDWSDELITLVAGSPRIANHAHVPMQSGSDAVLRRMHRKYRPWHYREKILKIRKAMPTAAIGADVMVGFPGESEADFTETRNMVEELPFTYLHVFTYSARPGTPAAAQPGQVPVRVARERNAILREIAASKKASFLQSLVGGDVEAITLQASSSDFTEALTDNYLKIKIRGKLPANHWLKCSVLSIDGEKLVGVDATGEPPGLPESASKPGKLIDLQPVTPLR